MRAWYGQCLRLCLCISPNSGRGELGGWFLWKGWIQSHSRWVGVCACVCACGAICVSTETVGEGNYGAGPCGKVGFSHIAAVCVWCHQCLVCLLTDSRTDGLGG